MLLDEQQWHSHKVKIALQVLWAEVVRCRSDERKRTRPVSIDYGACLAVLRGSAGVGREIVSPSVVPFDWEDKGRGAVPPTWDI